MDYGCFVGISHHLIQPPVVEPIPGEAHSPAKEATGSQREANGLENAAKNNKQLFAGGHFSTNEKNIYVSNNNIYLATIRIKEDFLSCWFTKKGSNILFEGTEFRFTRFQV